MNDLTKEDLQEDPDDNYGHHKGSVFVLALAALGVVYGDIGTSPLYAIKECFHGIHAIQLSKENVFGVLSLAVWSLTIVICIKYLIFVMRADNRGEGGMFALLALIPTDKTKISKRTRSVVGMAALLGASLLYGDGVITPTMSVLSAVEGLEVITTSAKNITVPLTCVILFFLFYVQKFGTAKIGRIFGPIMILWFGTLSVLGIINIMKFPGIFAALNPEYAIEFFMHNGYKGFLILGSVVLCITGGEALYADMGHFGRKPIQFSWFTIVFPSLILNYFGQGALLLSNPLAVSNPFYSMLPKYLVLPMVFLATIATVIASQALISGVFSITRQGIQMGFLPRLNIIHTSEETEGQIYIPSINKLMMIACIAIVIVFKQSSSLAAAYGLAVTADMVLTSTVFFFVITKAWKWPLYRAIPLVAFFLVFDLSYFAANLLKFWDGGWFPFMIAMFVLNIMLIWRDGREELGKQIKAGRSKTLGTGYISALSVQSLNHGTTQLSDTINQNNDAGLPLDILLGEILPTTVRVSGTAVFMSVSLKGIPPVLLHHLKHNQVLHEQVIFLSIKSLDVPVVRKNKLEVTEIGYGFYQIKALYGFMETPNVPDIIRLAEQFGLNAAPESTTYYLGRETIVISPIRATMMTWRKVVFTFMSKNAQPATAYFSIPATRVVELGMQIEI
ncbi:potassium transporter Kup [bacterium]|nr:MAG: potassium transporter Kup [bacterium]